MYRQKWYIVGYVVAVLILAMIYMMQRADAQSTTIAYFAMTDLPPGSIISKGDIESREGIVMESDEKRLLTADGEDALIGGVISPYGVRKDRPLLLGDVIESGMQLHELKLVGDITIPEEAKIVTVTLVYDQRNFPDKGVEVLASNVPVKQVYNNQNIPITASDTKNNRVPRAISIFVTDEQKGIILGHYNKGILHFTTMP